MLAQLGSDEQLGDAVEQYWDSAEADEPTLGDN
jgi:hypothetical protein